MGGSIRALLCLAVLVVGIFSYNAARAADMECIPYERGRFSCTEYTYTDLYSWSLPFGGQGNLDVPNPSSPMLARFDCSNINDPPPRDPINGGYIQDGFYATVQVWLPHVPTQQSPNGRVDTSNPHCLSISPAGYLALEAEWAQWEFNVMYYYALITQAGMLGPIPTYCYYFGTPFTCWDEAGWNGYGVTMFMMGWYNNFFAY